MFKTLDDTVKLLGHQGRTIDVFKIDCDRGILIEVHPQQSFIRPKGRLPGTVNMFKALRDAGYVITHKEPTIMYALKGHCVEYNLLLLSQDFWDDE
eukprot:scaffold4693_cov82-Skeletonema_marinoi.AAC.2